MTKYLFIFLSFIAASSAKEVFWFTGLPCSGKTTIAESVCKEFPEFIHLDGDVIRKTLNADLGYSPQDRQKNLERIAQLALTKLDEAETVVVTTISPLETQRDRIRQLIGNGGADFYLVYVETGLNTCIERDVKGMYAKALRGEIQDFTGISAPYDPPKHPDLIFKTEIESLQEILLRFTEFYRSLYTNNLKSWFLSRVTLPHFECRKCLSIRNTKALATLEIRQLSRA